MTHRSTSSGPAEGLPPKPTEAVMMDWLSDAMPATSPAHRHVLLRRRGAVDSMLPLELRDRWGHQLEPHKLAQIAEYVVLNLDHTTDADGFPVLVTDGMEAVDRLLCAMTMGDVPQVCSAPDTPIEDDDAMLIIEVALGINEEM